MVVAGEGGGGGGEAGLYKLSNQGDSREGGWGDTQQTMWMFLAALAFRLRVTVLVSQLQIHGVTCTVRGSRRDNVGGPQTRETVSVGVGCSRTGTRGWPEPTVAGPGPPCGQVRTLQSRVLQETRPAAETPGVPSCRCARRLRPRSLSGHLCAFGPTSPQTVP